MVSKARDFGVYFQSNLHTNHLGYRRLSLTQTKLIPSSSRRCLTTKAKAPAKGALIHVSLVISLLTSFTHIYNTSNTTLLHTLHPSAIITKAPRYTTNNTNQPPTTHAVFPICSLKKASALSVPTARLCISTNNITNNTTSPRKFPKIKLYGC